MNFLRGEILLAVKRALTQSGVWSLAVAKLQVLCVLLRALRALRRNV